MHELNGKRVVVMGLGRFGGGVGAARFCVREGADVLVTDLLKEDELRQSRAQLDGLPIRYRLGNHEEADFAGADFVIVNPAVDPRNNRFIQAAAKAGVTLTTEIELLTQRLPNRGHTVGITGTAGKSTTTAMIGAILSRALGPGRVHVGGNIGGSLLGKLHEIRADDWVVLELSSFMLETLEFSPHIAVVTNLSDNHLDRHDTLESYAGAKQRILLRQTAEDFAVLGESVADWMKRTPGRSRIVNGDYAGPLLLPGAHNRFNASAAAIVADLVGVSRADTEAALGEFTGLLHRLQFVCDHNGVRYYNDSKSTTPSSAVLALESFPERSAHLILGGYDKHAELSELAKSAGHRAAAVYTIGQTGPAIADAAEAVRGGCPVHRCGDLETAVKRASLAAKPGEVVLLSPGCASWDQFENYEARGRSFAELALRFTDRE